ncbi:MAG: tetratricopeptide repeat protein [Hungatella sp.]|nr:tetratricopeptide repeat protein [Hungatella sp.]
MKKWVMFVMAVMAVVIMAMVYKSCSMELEDYLELAETFHERGAYDRELFNLEKALERALKIYGPEALETADIYRKIGLASRDSDVIAESFGNAIAIYGLTGKKELAHLYYERGMRLMELDRDYLVDQVCQNLEAAAMLYETYGYGCSDELCQSYLALARLEEDGGERWAYLEKAGSHFWEISKANSWELGNGIYRAMGTHCLNEGMYEEAFEIFNDMLIRAEDSSREDTRKVMAEAQYMSGAALALLYKGEEGIERIEEAMAYYEMLRGTGKSDRDGALACSFLALAYGSADPPSQEKVLAYGEKALLYYTVRDSLSSEDEKEMEYIEEILETAYDRAFPERGEWDFYRWYRNYSQPKGER